MYVTIKIRKPRSLYCASVIDFFLFSFYPSLSLLDGAFFFITVSLLVAKEYIMSNSPARPKLQWQPSTVVSANRAGLMPQIAENFKQVLEGLGEDPERPGLVDTPKRAAQALLFFTKGYEDR